jgi:hypothetical protein
LSQKKKEKGKVKKEGKEKVEEENKNHVRRRREEAGAGSAFSSGHEKRASNPGPCDLAKPLKIGHTHAPGEARHTEDVTPSQLQLVLPPDAPTNADAHDLGHHDHIPYGDTKTGSG